MQKNPQNYYSPISHLNVIPPANSAIASSHWRHRTAPLSRSSRSGRWQTDQKQLERRKRNRAENQEIHVEHQCCKCLRFQFKHTKLWRHCDVVGADLSTGVV